VIAFFDPAAGTGGFLIDAVEHILAKYSREPQEVPIYGEEWLESRSKTIGKGQEGYPQPA
jgi:type I restriction enzyme M protein